MTDLPRQRIKTLRKEKGWSQAELARRTGIHSSTISHMESGHVKLWPGYARRIAQALGVPVDIIRGEAA